MTPTCFYTPDLLASLSDGQLADHLYEMIDIDPDGLSEEAQAIHAEVERRCLSEAQLSAAWNKLAAEQTS